MSRFCVRLSLFIRAVFDLDIAFRTQERLPFVRGAEIRMRPRRMRCIGPPQCWQVGLSSASKARRRCLADNKHPRCACHSLNTRLMAREIHGTRCSQILTVKNPAGAFRSAVESDREHCGTGSKNLNSFVFFKCCNKENLQTLFLRPRNAPSIPEKRGSLGQVSPSPGPFFWPHERVDH